MYNKHYVVISVVLGVLLIALIGGGIWWIEKQSKKAEIVIDTPPLSTDTNQDIAGNNVPITTEAEPESDALRVARLFVERFGSYSSHEAFAGIGELKPLMTPKLQAWVETQYLPTLNSGNNNDQYSGQSTKVLSAEIIKISSGEATVQVAVQKSITGIDDKTTIVYPVITVELLKQGDSWIVDGVFTKS